MRGKLGHGSQDRAIRRLAEDQHGVLTRAQLSQLGLGSDAIDHRLRLGRLCGIHRGVYAIVGTRLLTKHGHWMAGVLASGPGAVLSYLGAAALWGMRSGTRIEVTVPRGGRKPREGIQLHYANLPADEVTVHHGIPVTTVARTLLDLSALVQRHELRSAFRQAEQLRLTDAVGVHALVERYPRKRGIPIIRAVVQEAERGLNVIRGELEERFQAFLLDAGLPLPGTNVFIEGFEVDCVWPAARLIVELDSRTHHAVAHAFEQDRARDRRLEAVGWRVVRITWRQLHDTPGEVEADLRSLMAPGRVPQVRSR